MGLALVVSFVFAPPPCWFRSSVVGPPPRGAAAALTLVQYGVGWLVPCQRLLGEVLVALSQALGLGKAGVEGHGGVRRLLREVQVGRPPKLLLNHQRLLQELRAWGGD